MIGQTYSQKPCGSRLARTEWSQKPSCAPQVPELQQRKCAIMFELSCNLERILEFLAQELPALFLAGPEMNLSRLCELITFVLNHTTAGPDAGLFDR